MFYKKKGFAHTFTKDIARISSLINGATNIPMSYIIIFLNNQLQKGVEETEIYKKAAYCFKKQ